MDGRALLHVLTQPSCVPALALLLALVFEGCSATGSKAPRFPLSATYAGVASVRAKLLMPADAFEEATYAGMTRVTLKVESLSRLLYVRSSQVGIEVPDGRQFHPMSPEVANERVTRQRALWWQTRPPEFGRQAFQNGGPDAAAPTPASKPERTEPLVSRKVVDAVCSSTKFARTASPDTLILLVPCGAVAALHYATLPEGAAQTDSDDRQRSLRRAYLGNDLTALKEVELGNDDTATGTLVFPVATEEIRAIPGAVMTIPILEWRTKREVVARIVLTPLEPNALRSVDEASGEAQPAAAPLPSLDSEQAPMATDLRSLSTE